MEGQRIGYRRVSSIDQTTARQLEGMDLAKVFEDHASGKDTQRPQLTLCLEFLRAGDTLVVHSMDRLARNLDDLRRIVKTLTGKGVKVEFVKESLTFTGDSNPMSTLLLSVMGAFAEFERALILERQREGIAIAKRNGVYKGRTPTLKGEKRTEAVSKVQAGVPLAKVAREYGVSRQTLYSYIGIEKAQTA